jgi:SAM-dependent methyltransferase
MRDRKAVKRLASLPEVKSHSYKSFMDLLNQVAHGADLEEYTTYSRLWEYPWVWSNLEPLRGRGLRVLDIGSEKSPFPWFLATQGFDVIVSDVTTNYWRVWKRARERLGVTIRTYVLNAQFLAIPTASVDIYLSVSVLEHIRNKARAIVEAARVLRPGGLLIMTFDICESKLGMTFPTWNGRALTMREFDDLFKKSPWFEPGLSEISWNTEDVPPYLAWHRTTAPHHNYVTGASIVRRSPRTWMKPTWNDRSRIFKEKSQHSLKALRRKVACPIKSFLRGWLF